MSGIRDLPERVFRFIEEGVVSEFATLSKAGVPIDTPTYYFPSEDMATIDVATGQSYPAKAERARHTPKVGLLMEGYPEEPVVAMRGMAAVRDANLQANAVRYISETGFKSIAFGLDWSGARKAVWYWTRIIVEVMPERIVLVNSRCPFGAEVQHSPSLCRMTSAVFGGIAARNADEAAVSLDERIAVGDPGCRVVVHLGAAAKSAQRAHHYTVAH